MHYSNRAPLSWRLAKNQNLPIPAASFWLIEVPEKLVNIPTYEMGELPWYWGYDAKSL
jgi:hypothetical protein